MSRHWAYYNEIDPYAAQWLRNLIAAGEIADGYVDERSIVDVRPADLVGFTQCHFFAGIGVWSRALRQAGWPDDRPVWTGSCPCQPFSDAGQGGGFDDERHLWPFWHHFIRVSGAPNIFGEQVASKDGLGWLDLVQADLEGTDYACWPVDMCAAGIGAPHIRQRLWFTAVGLVDCSTGRRREFGSTLGTGHVRYADGGRRELGVLDHHHHHHQGPQGHAGHGDGGRGRAGALGPVAAAGVSHLMDHTDCASAGDQVSAGRQLHGVSGDAQRLADADGEDSGAGFRNLRSSEFGSDAATGGSSTGIERPGPTNSLWGDADWLLCRDGKWRPVEPGTFPLAHGAASRVGRLRAYGNAIVLQAAQTVIETYLEHERAADDGAGDMRMLG